VGFTSDAIDCLVGVKKLRKQRVLTIKIMTNGVKNEMQFLGKTT